MNTETPKKSKFDILEEIMINFQNDYEADNAQTHWAKTYKERKERLIQLQIDRKNEALDNAKTAKQESTSDRVDDILKDLIRLKFSQDQILALKQAVVAAAQNGEHNIQHWVSVRYSPDELQHISSLVADYYAQSIIEHSKQNVQAVEIQDNSAGVVKSEKTFAEQVDDVLAGNANRYNDLKVCDTPQILLDVGCEQLPMFYTKRHLHDALKPKGNTGESIHYHGLNAEQIKKMPMLLENPVIIYDSLSRNDSIIIVTSELDNEKMPIIAAIKPNGKAKYDLELVESNFVMSFHGRNNFENQINRAVEQNKVLYYNKEKSQELFSVLGLQLSKGLNILDSNIIIHQSRNIVKGTQQENIEYKNNSVTQQDIDILRSIEPRKSVLNFTAEELQQTKDWAERFENDIHKKSPFYRAANGEWRDKETTRAEIISISNYNVDFKKIREDIKKSDNSTWSFYK